MRHLITGMVTAAAVMAAAPAMACGYVNPCASYVAPVASYGYGYGGCGTGCGWATQRLADPVQQYYYVNQGPAYSGPGSWAPLPTYQESAVSGWGAYGSRPYYYGYNGGPYANPANHYYDGVGIEGPRVYGYRGYRAYRPYRAYRAYQGYRAYRPWRPRVSHYHQPRMSHRYGYAPSRAYSQRYAPAPYNYRPLRRYY